MQVLGSAAVKNKVQPSHAPLPLNLPSRRKARPRPALFAARTLNDTGQPRVTVRLR